MTLKKTLLGAAALVICSGAAAQSDGGSFDAAVVLVPGMAVERGRVTLAGTFQAGLLQHGDVVYTDTYTVGRYHILTSDGTVIGMGSGTAVAIDGRQRGFDVFRVLRGYADILGNVNDGYPLPYEFQAALPFRVGSITIPGDPYPFPNPFDRRFLPANRLRGGVLTPSSLIRIF